jgi:hypothetical protein
MNNHNPQDLEAKMHRVLRGLPDRKAPSGLEARILAELSRRAALPWWRKSFAYWPSAVRISFLAVSVLAAVLLASGLVLLGNSSGAHVLSGGFSNAYNWYLLARDIAVSARYRVGSLASSVPSLWLYGGIAALAVGYATLVAFGAATYRVLRPTPSLS